MKYGIAAFAVLALASLVLMSVWATGHLGIGAAISDLLAQPAAGNNPWFVATLFDTYFAFLWFWLWVAWREASVGSRLLWLLLILLGGNIAMATYVLLALWRLPPDATLLEAFVGRHAPPRRK
jgi:Protein of unknown function (DUF1475)